MAEKRERVTHVVRREPLVEKTCPGCGKTFLGLGRQRYCSMPCGKRASYWRHADKRRAEKREQYRRQKTTLPDQSAPDVRL